MLELVLDRRGSCADIAELDVADTLDVLAW